MAIAVDMTYTVSGMDTYHKACTHMGFPGGEHPAPGILFHWVEAVEGGFVVHEVWESEEQFSEFLEEQLLPYASWGRADFETLHTGPTVRFGQDLVFVNGQFVQWPSVLGNP